MRCLLDENTSPDVAVVLTVLGHPSRHVVDIGLGGQSDQAVFDAAEDFDLLITMDLHRKSDEWFGVREAMLGTVRVVRMRFRDMEHDDAMAQLRVLLWHWSKIEQRLGPKGSDIQATIHAGGSTIRFNSRDDLRSMRAHADFGQ